MHTQMLRRLAEVTAEYDRELTPEEQANVLMSLAVTILREGEAITVPAAKQMRVRLDLLREEMKQY